MKDSGAEANGYVERDLTIELRDLIASHTEVIKDNDFDTLWQLVEKLETKTKWNDIVCDLHFNASDNEKASGVECFISDKHIETEKRLANEMCQFISAKLKIPNRKFKRESESARGQLAIMSPNGINILPEICFITNKYDMSQYQMFKEELAIGLGEVLNRYASA